MHKGLPVSSDAVWIIGFEINNKLYNNQPPLLQSPGADVGGKTNEEC